MSVLLKYVILNIICIILAKKYEIKLLSLDLCKIEQKGMDKENGVSVSLSSTRLDRKTLIVSSNITVTKKTGPITVNFRAYELQRSLVKDLEYKMENLSCNHTDVVKSLSLLNIRMDKHCFILPGNYLSDNVTVNEVGEVFSKSVMAPGKYAYELDIVTKKGILTCFSIALEYSN